MKEGKRTATRCPLPIRMKTNKSTHSPLRTQQAASLQADPAGQPRTGQALSLLRLLLLSSAIPYGGQAAIEGVMMKGREHAALAVRRRDGRIEVIERVAKARWPKLATIPILRGVVLLIDMFGLGTWALR